MNRNKVTRWFSIARDGQPARKGWYEVRYTTDDKGLARRYWNGKQWQFAPGETRCGFGNIAADWVRESWRGLLHRASAARNAKTQGRPAE